MFRTSNLKSKASSSSRSHRSKHGGDDRGQKAKRKEVIESDREQGGQGDQHQAIDAGEIEDYEENSEDDSVENETIPRTVNDIQLPEREQVADEMQANEYRHERFDTQEISPQGTSDTYHSPYVTSQNNPSGSDVATPDYGSQSRSQGGQSHVPSGLLPNPSSWNSPPQYLAPSTMHSWPRPPGQSRSLSNPASYTPTMTPGSGYEYARNPYPQPTYQATPIGRSSAIHRPNVYPSTSMAAAGQFGRGVDNYDPISYTYSRGGLGGGSLSAGGAIQSGRAGHYFREGGQSNPHDQGIDERAAIYSPSNLPDRKDSGRDVPPSQELETPSAYMANLALTKGSPSEIQDEDSTDEPNYGEDTSLTPRGSLGNQGQHLSYDRKDLPQGNYKQNQPRKLPALDKSFRVHSSKSFKKGKVFKCLWSEPVGIATQKYQSGGQSLLSLKSEEFITNARYGETAFHRIRRFVIVKERKGFSLCVPILTYRYQGTNKPGVKADYHAMIHTGQKAPSPLPGEQLIQRAVRIELSSDSEKLEEESRVNYAKVYTVEHNIKVCFIGKIHDKSRGTFETDFKKIDDQDVEEN